MIKIEFYTKRIFFKLKRKRSLRQSLTQIFKSEKTSFAKLSFIFCSDAYLLKINQQFLKYDYYTDVITFNLSEKEGEIYISIHRVKQNAKMLKLNFEQELLRMMIHGILHLCGYNDKSPIEKKAMTKKENKYLSSLFHVKQVIP